MVRKAHSLAQESWDWNCDGLESPAKVGSKWPPNLSAEKVPRQLGGTDVQSPGKWLATMGTRCRWMATGRLWERRKLSGVACRPQHVAVVTSAWAIVSIVAWLVSVVRQSQDGGGRRGESGESHQNRRPKRTRKGAAATRSTDWCKILVLVEGGQGALIGLFLNQG